MATLWYVSVSIDQCPVADNSFKESSDRRINLPESERTVDILLDELYDTYNSTTGSLFTGFALRSKLEKERILNDLLDVFIASDKVCSLPTNSFPRH